MIRWHTHHIRRPLFSYGIWCDWSKHRSSLRNHRIVYTNPTCSRPFVPEPKLKLEQSRRWPASTGCTSTNIQLDDWTVTARQVRRSLDVLHATSLPRYNARPRQMYRVCSRAAACSVAEKRISCLVWGDTGNQRVRSVRQ